MSSSSWWQNLNPWRNKDDDILADGPRGRNARQYSTFAQDLRPPVPADAVTIMPSPTVILAGENSGRSQHVRSTRRPRGFSAEDGLASIDGSQRNRTIPRRRKRRPRGRIREDGDNASTSSSSAEPEVEAGDESSSLIPGSRRGTIPGDDDIEEGGEEGEDAPLLAGNTSAKSRGSHPSNNDNLDPENELERQRRKQKRRKRRILRKKQKQAQQAQQQASDGSAVEEGRSAGDVVPDSSVNESQISIGTDYDDISDFTDESDYDSFDDSYSDSDSDYDSDEIVNADVVDLEREALGGRTKEEIELAIAYGELVVAEHEQTYFRNLDRRVRESLTDYDALGDGMKLTLFIFFMVVIGIIIWLIVDSSAGGGGGGEGPPGPRGHRVLIGLSGDGNESLYLRGSI